MAKLGSFQVVKKTVEAAQRDPEQRPKYDTFDFEGEEFRVVDHVPSALPIMEFADAIQGIDDESLPLEALASIYALLQSCILPEDWGKFRRTANRSGADFDDLLPLSQQLWAAVVGRPTNGPSGSPDGPSPTGTSSKASSPAPTGPPSSTPDGRSGSSPSLVDLQHLEPANGWQSPPDRPDLQADLISIDDYLTGASAA